MIGKRNRPVLSIAGSVAAATMGALMTLPTVASAKIRCDGPYQVTSSGSVATPFCEADNLARVANSRGIEVSAAAIRANYSVLKRTCMALHGDSRVSGTCQLFTESPF